MKDIFLSACKNGQHAVVKAFLKKGGVKVDMRDAIGCTPLYYACNRGFIDVNAPNNQGATPLHRAAKNGDSEMVRLLIEGGADINVLDKNGRTPLIWSVIECKSDVTELLLQLEANADVKDVFGNDARYYAEESSDAKI